MKKQDIYDALLVLVIVVYVVMGIITFGHSANNERIAPIMHAMGADAAATVLWPLYWSWEVQK